MCPLAPVTRTPVRSSSHLLEPHRPCCMAVSFPPACQVPPSGPLPPAHELASATDEPDEHCLINL
ncbi:MAG: hypothetical protein PHF94_06555, partial [Methanothrix sp.]|nr:hypothetical protein [Methanothrix sp.]